MIQLTSTKPKKLSPFDFLNSINEGLRSPNIFSDASLEDRAYPAFMVNRGLSYFLDTILLANEMNRRAGSIPGKMQYEFLRRSIRPRKRFSKWFKNEEPDDLALIKRAYGYSSDKARNVLHLFSPASLALLRQSMDVGGK